MMGYQSSFQHKLFVMGFSLEKRIRKDHILRKILEKIDFDFIYKEAKDTYGENGNVSVPPPVILKIMLLLVLYNVRSERELILTIPERLDWLYFLGYDLDDEIPNHIKGDVGSKTIYEGACSCRNCLTFLKGLNERF